MRVLVSEAPPAGIPAEHVTRVPEHEIGERADLVIAIGGDGTLLYAARLVAGQAVPLSGSTAAGSGFSPTSCRRTCCPRWMPRSPASWRRISVRCSGRGCTAHRERWRRRLALNDVVMQKHDTGRTLDFETRINGNYVNTHDGDGIIVASPTGSTAYALSCSGPIIEPHLPALVIVPICAHTLSDRPIVVAAESVIEITLLERPDTRANVTCDGKMLGAIVPGDRLEITTAAERVTLLHPPGHDYYGCCARKLHWGRGSFER